MKKEEMEKRVATLGRLIQEQPSLKYEYNEDVQKPKLEKPRRRKLFDNLKKLF